MNRWAGRVAFVTGASSGIGAAIAKELVKHGMKVVGVARRLDMIQVNNTSYYFLIFSDRLLHHIINILLETNIYVNASPQSILLQLKIFRNGHRDYDTTFEKGAEIKKNKIVI